MKVILLQNIDKLGKKYDIKEVSDGFARNFLIPKGLVKIATKENLNWLEKIKEKEKKVLEKELKDAQELVKEIDGFELEMPVKIGEKGELFEKIGPQQIAKALKEKGFKIEKNQIELEEKIKEIGEYKIKIKLPHNLETEIKVIVKKE
jgi:large subunit ribosomal protein L9